ncbi:MAG: IS1634 family transposase [Alteromonadaceae bacterium]|nr:IS1634 family transposase [Alteromonadaceae bacterium]
MIINGLGFCTNPLYLSEQFFLDTPVDILIGENLTPAHFNDDALGRTLDALHQFGTTKLFCRIAFDLVKGLNLLGPTLHIDTTSLALFGEYDVDECDNTPKPTYGHSKDHRPDLKQIVVTLIATGPAGVPLWFETHDGNSSDKASFHETIKEFNSLTQALKESDSFLWVADSALYTQGKLQESGIKWLTHPPAIYKPVKNYLAQPYSNFDWEPLTKEYQSTMVQGPEGEHWQLILSGQRRKSALKALDRRITKDFEAKTKAFNALSKTLFACENDAKEPFQYSKKRVNITSSQIKQLKLKWVTTKQDGPKQTR